MILKLNVEVLCHKLFVVLWLEMTVYLSRIRYWSWIHEQKFPPRKLLDFVSSAKDSTNNQAFQQKFTMSLDPKPKFDSHLLENQFFSRRFTTKK